MEMVKIRFGNEEERSRAVIALGKRMSVLGVRGGYYIVPAGALPLLDEWGYPYSVLERGGYDVLVGSLRGASARTV